MLTNLFFVRHGAYSKQTGLLTQRGLEEAHEAAKAITKGWPMTWAMNTIIASSPQPRTMETAKRISSVIGMQHFCVSPCLDLDSSGEKILRGLPQTAARYPDAMNLIVVTHGRNILSFAETFNNSELHNALRGEMDTGAVLQINLDMQTVRRLTPEPATPRTIVLPREEETILSPLRNEIAVA